MALSEKQRKVLREAADIIESELSSNGGAPIVIKGFGTFRFKARAARTGRNPSTGAPVEIPARVSIAFKASRAY